MAQLAQDRERIEVPAGNRGSVLEPEVEQIADDIERGRAPTQRRQEGMKATLAVGFVRARLRAEVRVGQKERRPLGHARQNSNADCSITTGCRPAMERL